jgi:hypothetical protein
MSCNALHTSLRDLGCKLTCDSLENVHDKRAAPLFANQRVVKVKEKR